MTLEHEQKLEALKAIGEVSLRMRKPGDWYVEHRGPETKTSLDSSILSGPYGNGKTPEEAVDDHWNKLAVQAPFVVLHAYSTERRRVLQWNGFMWADVKENR